MLPKALKNTLADIFTLFEGHYFIVSDKGNFAAITTKRGTIRIENYDGTLSEYLTDYDLDKAGSRKTAYVQDYFKDKIIES